MRHFPSSIAFKLLFPLFIFLFLLPRVVQAQSCSPVENFKTGSYSVTTAVYEWDYAQDALSYTLELFRNGQPYYFTELPGYATKHSVSFDPELKHNDKIDAKITKYCGAASRSESTDDFIIVIDAIVYLIGDPSNGGLIKVEPVFAINDNLSPNAEICGLCEPDFFRLTSGFYAPYGIAVSTTSALPIEQLRFKKGELCGCIKDAVAAGILSPTGGQGPKYTGTPFTCRITPYAFLKEDCERKIPGRGGERTDGSTATSTPFHLAPNPATNTTQIQFSLTEESVVSITIYDIMGKAVENRVDQTKMLAGDYNLDVQVDNYPSGIYYCTLRTKNGLQTLKLSVASK